MKPFSHDENLETHFFIFRFFAQLLIIRFFKEEKSLLCLRQFNCLQFLAREENESCSKNGIAPVNDTIDQCTKNLQRKL